MKWSEKVVTQLPLTQLWTVAGPVEASRRFAVGQAEVAGLLRGGPLRFVVADVGRPLRWVPEAECFPFWKAEVRERLVAADATSWRLEDYAGEYCYRASAWASAAGEWIVLLEMSH